MPKLFKSKRITLRPITHEDLPILRTLHSDEEVMKYIGNGELRTEQQSISSIDRMLKVEAENPLLGAWIVIDHEKNEPVGNTIIRIPATDETTEGIEIGFSFFRNQWRKGYATQTIQAMIEYTRQYLKEKKVVALIDPRNDASRNTLLKSGFKYDGESIYVDQTTGAKLPSEILAYEITEMR